MREDVDVGDVTQEDAEDRVNGDERSVVATRNGSVRRKKEKRRIDEWR